MFALINIGLILLTTFLFSVSFFLIERVKSTDYVIGLKINEKLKEIITGVIYSGLFILFQIIMENISDQFDLQVYLIGFVVLLITLNYRVALYSIPLALIYYVFTNTIGAESYAEIISFFSLGVVALILESLLEIRIEKLILYGTGIIIGLLAFVIVGAGFDKGLSAHTFALTMLPLILFPIMDYLVSYFIRTSQEANVLYESINFVYGNFYRETIKEREIGELISRDKVEQGIYALLRIEYEELSPEEGREILNSVLSDIQNIVPRETVLFHNGGNSYGFFLPTSTQNKIKYSIDNNDAASRPVDDPIKSLEKYLLIPSKKYKTLNGNVSQVQLFAGVSMYGTQSSSIETLNTASEFALKLNREKIGNRISVFNPALFRAKVTDSYKVQTLDNTIGLDNFANRFIPVVNIDSKKVDYQFTFQINVSETEFIDDVKVYVKDLGILDTFERYYAVDALRKARDNTQSLIIDYSVNLFSENFKVEEFIRQINVMKINKDKLILLSDYDSVYDLEKVGEIVNTINVLKSEGIKFAVNSFEKTPFAFDLYVVSSSTIIDEDRIIDRDKVIVPDIDTEERMEEVLKKGIKFVGGPILQTNINLMKLNKQSKMYIEELTKRGKDE